MRNCPPINTDKQQCQGEAEKMDEESPEPGKRPRDFFFLGGFEIRIQSTGSLPDPHLHFHIGVR